ncbi:hypothetical protein COCVIDRAFT_41556 [Bipolaris victoriae FI3]|uniref:DUF7607 domain-containing protein n=1 Tax=Bipolaris victoriae (strain FI3) TaxID=930091 RepID=W7DX53_BIPV3|nr:hypothetical protein COCVIDRAFT_41556 [Bipolaris victoriae FI3]
MSTNDPWLWSVDELVASLCHSPTLFINAGHSVDNIPDSSTLETGLRAQNMTGKTLLTSFAMHEVVITNKLNISRISQRFALHAVIELLRRDSRGYHIQHATNTSEVPLNNNAPNTSPIAQIIRSPQVASNQRGTEPKRSRAEIIPAGPVRQTLQTQMQTHDTSNEFDHLLRWQNTAEDDEVIDFAVANIQQDDESIGTDEDEEIDDPQEPDEVEVPSGRNKLPPEQIVNIINECIDAYSKSWKPNAGVPRGEEVDYDVHAMWDEAEASGQRKNLVQKYEEDHAYFSNRLNKLCDEIVNAAGSNPNEVRTQCRNLETTIQAMELAGWLREIYELEPVDSDDELAASADDISMASLPRPQAIAATEIINLDTSPEPSEIGEAVSTVEKPLQDVADNTGNLLSHQRRTLTPDFILRDIAGNSSSRHRQSPSPELAITQSIEPIVNKYHRPLHPNGPRHTPILRRYGDDPENASINSVRRWKWKDLTEHLDRKRIVSKTIFEMDGSGRESVRIRVQLIDKTCLLREIAACIDMLWRGESKLQGVLPRDMAKITRFTNIFLSWWFCRNYFDGPNASTAELEELKSCLSDGSAGASTFYDYLCKIMETTFSEQALQHPDQPSQAEIIEISDDD